MQYHPAVGFFEAKYQAMQALVIRELLIQQAVKARLYRQASDQPDEIIDKLLDQEISVPNPTREECERYYNNNKRQFFTEPLFEVSHILYPAPPDHSEARERAREKAVRALIRIKEDPKLFTSIAQAESACPSNKEAGRLGQISKGQTVPAFEAALIMMKESEISKEPVATEVGYHIIFVHRRADGRLLPFDSVVEWIADFLKQESWRRAFRQYIQILASQAEIKGFLFKKIELERLL